LNKARLALVIRVGQDKMIEGYYRRARDLGMEVLNDVEAIKAAHQEAMHEQREDGKAGHCALWVNVQTPTHEELDWLQQNFNLHPLVLEDIVHRDQRSKLEEYHDYMFLVLHSPAVEPRNQDLNWEELHIVISKHWVVTALDKDSPRLEQAIKKIATSDRLFERGLGSLVYHLCDGIVDAYFPIMDDSGDQMDQMEEVMLDKPDHALLDQMFKLKRNLVEMRRFLSPQRDVFRTLLDRSDDYFDVLARPYFRDIYDHMVRVYDSLDSLRDQVGNATDLYLSVVNNNMNLVMKRLTVITTIFMPITFVTGVFGMNFGHSPQVENDPGWFFWACIFTLAIIASVMIITLRRLKFI